MASKLSRRLVLTGHDAQGVSRVMAERIVTGVGGPAMAGAEVSQLWGADKPLSYPDEGAIPDYAAFYAPIHGTRLVELYLPAHSEKYDAVTDDDPNSGAAALSKDRPGMHRTATTDMIIVMEGKVDCQLDEERVTLNTGDVLIQSGTMHAWYNPYDIPCRFVAVMIGAENGLCE